MMEPAEGSRRRAAAECRDLSTTTSLPCHRISVEVGIDSWFQPTERPGSVQAAQMRCGPAESSATLWVISNKPTPRLTPATQSSAALRRPYGEDITSAPESS